MRAADHIIDVGPEAGSEGGEIVFEGSLDDVEKMKGKETLSHTVRFLNGTERIATPSSRRQWNLAIEVKGARMNNLRGIDVRERFGQVVTNQGNSVSGSEETP